MDYEAELRRLIEKWTNTIAVNQQRGKEASAAGADYIFASFDGLCLGMQLAIEDLENLLGITEDDIID